MTAESILKKLLEEGDIHLYDGNMNVAPFSGAGLDYSWVFLTQEEVDYLKVLRAT